MASTYKYQVHIHSINAIVVDVAKINESNLVGVQSFKLRLHPVPEGEDPIAMAIAKHRDQLRW